MAGGGFWCAMKLNCLVTGADGFVGRHLCRVLRESEFTVTGSSRYAIPNADASHQSSPTLKPVGPIDGATDWQAVLGGQEVVVHLANRAHRAGEREAAAQDLYRAVNLDGSLNLARQAASNGARLFIYVSSIKVNGESTGEQPFSNKDKPSPQGAYAISKYETEQALQDFCAGNRMQLVIIRPPLIYGPGVKGNLSQLLWAVKNNIPLPIASIGNQRDLISLGNFASLIQTCIDNPASDGHVFLCCDQQPLSTPELVRQMALASGKMAMIFPFPVKSLEMLGRMIGREDAIVRLTSDLRVDMEHTQNILSWQPPYSVAESMQWAFSNESHRLGG